MCNGLPGNTQVGRCFWVSWYPYSEEARE